MLALLRLLSHSVVTKGQGKQKFGEIVVFGVRLIQKLICHCWLETVHDLGLVRKVLESCLIIFLITSIKRVLTITVISNVRVQLLSFFLSLIVANYVTDFESGYVAKTRIYESCFWTNDRVNLAKGLHRAKISEHYVCRHQIDVPKHKVGVEIDHSLHNDVWQIGQVEHEISHSFRHCEKLFKACFWL